MLLARSMVLHLVAIVFAASSLFATSAAHAQKRIALVVGNSAYVHAPPLPNPRNDATAMGDALKKLGFEVIGGNDLDRTALVKALVTFGRAAEHADVALIFYAGHGVQINGKNYLVPIDADVDFESEVDFTLVSLTQVLEQLERGSRTNIVFLDACRQNPFEKKLARSMGTRAIEVLGRGLSRVPSVTGTFIAFATEPDNVAADGTDGHSPFSEALLKHIQTPGESLSDMMIDVRKEVIDATGGKQVPWDSSSLTGRFAFAPGAAMASPQPEAKAAPAPPQVPAPGDTRSVEMAVWSAIQGAGDVATFRKFLKDFPDGVFAGAAQARITSLTTPEPPPVKTAAISPTPSPEPAPQVPPPQAPPQQAAPPVGSLEAQILAVNVGNEDYGGEMDDFGIPSQFRLKTGAVGAPTPTSIPGAYTLSTRQMQDIVARHGGIYVDVLGDYHQQSIPGTVRLPVLGTVAGNASAERAKAGFINRLTRGNMAVPIVFFCLGVRC